MEIDILQERNNRIEEAIYKVKCEFENTYPSENGLMIPEIMVLYYARSFRTDSEFFQSFWRYSYGIDDVRSVLNMLLERGFIFVGSPIDGISNYKIAELKNILDQFGLKKTGNKKDLILRIVQNIDETELDNIITSKPYGLTQLGIEELENNQYIPYFHKTKCEYSQPINVRWLNCELHDRPMYRDHWRDRIWGELNAQAQDAMIEMTKGNFYDYIQNRRTMALFMIERNEYLTALSLLTESLYYHLNKREPRYILRDYQYYVVEKHENMPENKWLVSPFVKMYISIKEQLKLNNEEFAETIRKHSDSPILPDEIISVNLIAAWVLAEIMNNERQKQFLYDKYINGILRNRGFKNEC